MGPKVIGRKPFQKLSQCAGQTSQPRCTFAIGKQQRAIAVTNVNGPDALYRIQPGFFFNVKSTRLQLGLHGVDSGLEGGVFAKDKVFVMHGGAYPTPLSTSQRDWLCRPAPLLTRKVNHFAGPLHITQRAVRS